VRGTTRNSAIVTLILGILHSIRILPRLKRKNNPPLRSHFNILFHISSPTRIALDIVVVSSASIHSSSFFAIQLPARTSQRLDFAVIAIAPPNSFPQSFESNHTVINPIMSTNHPSPLARQTSAKKQKTEHEQDEDGIPIPEVT
jgi:hypothetical protein